MDIKPVSPQFSTCAQITTADLEHIAEQGYKTVINFRPDGEGGATQPASEQLAGQAALLGLAYVYLPVVPNQIQPAQVASLQSALGQHPGPFLGFCRTGNRANAIYQQALQTMPAGKPACCGQKNTLWTARVTDLFKK